MTKEGVKELYNYLMTAWPLVIRSGADEKWKREKLRELYMTYADYTDAEVIEAFRKWTEEQDRFPSTSNILNEIKWTRVQAQKVEEDVELWPMDFVAKDGTEWSFGMYKRSDFVRHPRNTEHLQPEEWERRFNLTRKRFYEKLQKQREAERCSGLG